MLAFDLVDTSCNPYTSATADLKVKLFEKGP